MTEEQEQLEANLKETAAFKALQENDSMFQEELEELKSGQNEIKVHLDEVDERLEDGSAVMKGLIKDVKELYTFLRNQAQRNEEMHRETKDALKDHRYQDIKEEKKALQNIIDDGKKRKWDVVKIIGAAIAGAAVSFAIAKLS